MRRGGEILMLGSLSLVCGIAAVLSLSIRWYVTGHRYAPLRYSEFGGAAAGALDTVLAFACGALLGAGLATRLTSEQKASRAWPWFLDVVPAITLAYLVIAANFGR